MNTILLAAILLSWPLTGCNNHTQQKTLNELVFDLDTASNTFITDRPIFFDEDTCSKNDGAFDLLSWDSEKRICYISISSNNDSIKIYIDKDGNFLREWICE